MWIVLAFCSAALLGFYDVFKKKALTGNAVIPVLALNTLFCSAIFLPLIICSASGIIGTASQFYVPTGGMTMHLFILIKAVIVLSSWICGYVGMKNLPITIVGPINATRPVMTLLGALFVFGETLNAWQWAGVAFAVISFYMLSRSGKHEGVEFSHNKWIACVVAAAFLGAVSALYDKFLMAPVGQGGIGMNKLAVQGWSQLLPNAYDGRCAYGSMVSAPQRGRQVPFQLGHRRYLGIPYGSRFPLFLCLVVPRSYDFHCVDGKARQCDSFVPFLGRGCSTSTTCAQRPWI